MCGCGIVWSVRVGGRECDKKNIVEGKSNRCTDTREILEYTGKVNSKQTRDSWQQHCAWTWYLAESSLSMRNYQGSTRADSSLWHSEAHLKRDSTGAVPRLCRRGRSSNLEPGLGRTLGWERFFLDSDSLSMLRIGRHRSAPAAWCASAGGAGILVTAHGVDGRVRK